MAYGFIQSNYANDADGITFSSSGSTNLLLVMVDYTGTPGDILSVGGGTFTRIGTDLQDSFNYISSAWRYEGNPGGITSAAIGWGAGSPGTRRIWFLEYSGIATSGALITFVRAAQASPGTGTDAVTSGSTSVTVSGGALVVGWASDAGGGAVQTAGTGYTSRSPTGNGAVLEDKRITTTGSNAATSTSATNPGSIMTWMMAFAEPSLSVATTAWIKA